ncbi:2-oxoacid:acceptor oxidoreductase subunit alpha [Promethearchaeum syntrophicum]|uniref:2-oxoacid:acceptor oxidoreductase subunit alpha n=1 Tax=Promethearchaeum syntrophicum TaxID=2594042 RepID=A0A5B9D7T2_9ARCH|nr:2-oxoacid:acceptor oxidoreductase subunit alpha [Candidatus Prometheoarchaeum syntrophicum]QEE15288.1 2-oxoglutarate synthase subunit KorA [Candidatus Prometheoarchaeum syntrophicum]
MNKKISDLSIVIAGAAGQGVQTVEELLVGILKMSGYNIFATKEYESRVRGGSNSTEIRVSSNRVTTFVNRIDLLIPLNPAALLHVKSRLSENSMILSDPSLLDGVHDLNEKQIISFPFSKIASEVGSKIYANVVAVGAIAGMFITDPNIAKIVLTNRFSSKGSKIINKNFTAFQKGYELGKNVIENGKFTINLSKNDKIVDEILLNGNEAVGLGAIAGGCNFISAYPMSPSTGALQFLAANSEEFGIIIDQAEDEIAAINKNVAAWYAGARALASTSGGGFALMTEGVSLAGIMENPIVIHIAQRPGPATGLPTRTAQEDLNLALYAGHGEFARIIFAPGTIEQAFYLTQKAFNLADKYQIPVFVLTDQNFVDGYYNIPQFDLSRIKVDNSFIKTEKDYLRYKFTENGISPRGIPGYGEGLVRADSDEHTEAGQITEDMEYIRPEMVKKRYYKRLKLLEEVADEPKIVGATDYSTLIVCWGSNYTVVKEAIEEFGNKEIAMGHFHQLFPLHSNTKEILNKAKKVILIESNASGQFANVLKLYGDFDIPEKQKYLNYSGKPFAVEDIIAILQKEVN